MTVTVQRQRSGPGELSQTMCLSACECEGQRPDWFNPGMRLVLRGDTFATVRNADFLDQDLDYDDLGGTHLCCICIAVFARFLFPVHVQ